MMNNMLSYSSFCWPNCIFPEQPFYSAQDPSGATS